MNFELWKRGIIKPFNSVEEFEKFEEELVKLPSLSSFTDSPLRKSKIKRGINVHSEKFDSFAEYTFVQYNRLIKLNIVERNHKSFFYTYTDNEGKICKFYPDFIVNGTYCEVKGRLNDKDRCKMEQCTDVKWFFQSDINQMSIELDKVFPNWRADFIQTN